MSSPLDHTGIFYALSTRFERALSERTVVQALRVYQFHRDSL
ncbi:hypothetical protein OAM67_00740 [bacterium]|nr:hypothetical protein [bacterium]